MLILSIETSSPRGSCSLARDGTALASRDWTRAASHSEIATAMIAEIARECSVELASIDAIAVGAGPGSFTGIRVAMTAAKTLAFALGKPIFVFDSGEQLAVQAQPSTQPILTLVEAHRDLVYVSAFEAGGVKRIKPMAAIRAGELASWLPAGFDRWLCVGRGFEAQANVWSLDLLARLHRPAPEGAVRLDSPDSLSLALLAERAAESGRSPLGWNEAQPLYVRASEAEEKLAETH